MAGRSQVVGVLHSTSSSSSSRPGGGFHAEEDAALKLVNPASSYAARAESVSACSTSGMACVAWHWALPRLAVLDAPSRIAVYSAETGERSAGVAANGSRLEVHALLQDDKRQSNVQSLAWRPNAGSVLAAGCDFGALVVWSTRTARSPRTEAAALSAQRWHAQPSCVCALSGCVLGADALYDSSRRGLLVRSIAWSPCGSLLACGVSVEQPLLQPALTSVRRTQLATDARGMAIFCGAALLAARSRTWNEMLTGEAPMRRLVMRGSIEEVESIAWSGDGGRVCAMATGNAGIWIWETITWTCVQWASPGLDVKLPLCMWGGGAYDVLLTVANAKIHAPGGNAADKQEKKVGESSARPVMSLLYMARETPELNAIHAVEMQLPGLRQEPGAVPAVITSMAMSEGRLAVAMAARGQEDVPRVAIYAVRSDPIFNAQLIDVIEAPDATAAKTTKKADMPRAPAVAMHATGLLAVNWDTSISSIHVVA